MESHVQNLESLALEHLSAARNAPHGRSVHMVAHDGPLRQSLIALAAANVLADHPTPTAASLQVLVGRIKLTKESGDVELIPGQIYALPHEQHGVTALEDAAFLLTTVTGV